MKQGKLSIVCIVAAFASSGAAFGADFYSFSEAFASNPYVVPLTPVAYNYLSTLDNSDYFNSNNVDSTIIAGHNYNEQNGFNATGATNTTTGSYYSGWTVQTNYNETNTQTGDTYSDVSVTNSVTNQSGAMVSVDTSSGIGYNQVWVNGTQYNYNTDGSPLLDSNGNYCYGPGC